MGLFDSLLSDGQGGGSPRRRSPFGLADGLAEVGGAGDVGASNAENPWISATPGVYPEAAPSTFPRTGTGPGWGTAPDYGVEMPRVPDYFETYDPPMLGSLARNRLGGRSEAGAPRFPSHDFTPGVFQDLFPNGADMIAYNRDWNLHQNLKAHRALFGHPAPAAAASDPGLTMSLTADGGGADVGGQQSGEERPSMLPAPDPSPQTLQPSDGASDGFGTPDINAMGGTNPQGAPETGGVGPYVKSAGADSQPWPPEVAGKGQVRAPAGSDVLQTNYPRPLGAPETGPGSPTYNPYAAARELDRRTGFNPSLAPDPTAAPTAPQTGAPQSPGKIGGADRQPSPVPLEQEIARQNQATAEFKERYEPREEKIGNPFNQQIQTFNGRKMVPRPDGEKGGTITMVNDDPKNPSPDLRVQPHTANAVEQLVRQSGYSVNVNSTTGGEHTSAKSPHYQGRGVDMNKIDGQSIGQAVANKDQTTLAKIERMQELAKQNPDVTAVYGPTKSWQRIDGKWVDVTAQQSATHQTHFHLTTL